MCSRHASPTNNTTHFPDHRSGSSRLSISQTTGLLMEYRPQLSTAIACKCQKYNTGFSMQRVDMSICPWLHQRSHHMDTCTCIVPKTSAHVPNNSAVDSLCSAQHMSAFRPSSPCHKTTRRGTAKRADVSHELMWVGIGDTAK